MAVISIPSDYPQLSVVVPLYNESACLEANIESIKSYLEKIQIEYELVLVDDGSSDSTEAICNTLCKRYSFIKLVSYPVNRGKGHAVRRGVLNSTGKYIIFMDADLAVPVSFISACLNQLKAGNKIVIGSRHLPGSFLRVREKPFREYLGKIFRRLTQLSLGLKTTDITCGFKGFDKKAGFDIFSRSKIERWGYDAEILFLAKCIGYSVTEIPVDWYHSFDSNVRIGIDSIRTLTELFLIRYYHLTGNYKYRPR